MSYHIYLFRTEVKALGNDASFLEDESQIEPFTAEQYAALKSRLSTYNFRIDRESPEEIAYSGPENTQAFLRPRALCFTSGFGDGLFEIMMTASEFTDTGEFAKYDPQEGEWEEI